MRREPVPLSAVLDWLGREVRHLAGAPDTILDGPCQVDSGGPTRLGFVTEADPAARRAVAASDAGALIVPVSLAEVPPGPDVGPVLIGVEQPRLTFVRVLARFFAPPAPEGIHASAMVEPHCRLGRSVYVGPFAYVAADEVGDGSQIHGHAHVGPGTVIGSRVIVRAGAVIGADGFGYERDADGRWLAFPHFGRVILADDVEVGANACIDRGTLGDTVIGRGVKIDDLVYVAHNVEVGPDAALAGGCAVAGSVRIGPRAWVAPGAGVRDQRHVGPDALVGLGAAVVDDVPAGATVVGVPARRRAR